MPSSEKLKPIVEAVLLSAGTPLNLDAILELFLEDERPDKKRLREVISTLQEEYQGRGVELAEVGGEFRINARAEYAPWVSRLWEERPPRYSRALLETLALIAYRQPITRGEIEDVRGVSVSSHIIKTLLEREWVRVVGHRDVPGRPSLYATTREFLNYFSLKGLGDLPTLQEIRDFESINRELELCDPGAERPEDEQPDEPVPAPGLPERDPLAEAGIETTGGEGSPEPLMETEGTTGEMSDEAGSEQPEAPLNPEEGPGDEPTAVTDHMPDTAAATKPNVTSAGEPGPDETAESRAGEPTPDE